MTKCDRKYRLDLNAEVSTLMNGQVYAQRYLMMNGQVYAQRYLMYTRE